jgi:acyl-CoA reductase-like NAD-dependent aldehyde dehydrogenase
MSGHERSKVMRDLADLLNQHCEELAQLETIDNGMPISTARVLVPMGIEALYFFAGAAATVSGQTLASRSDQFHYTLREPVGVVGSIIPWNGPMLAACWKIGPALAGGNAIVLKPAEETPLSAMRLAELAVEAGVPPGVINVLTGFGPGAGSAIAEHPGVDKVSFTGSVEVGKKILEASKGNLKRLTLELGGKSPNIVFPDADLANALPASVMAYTFNSGQVCVAGTRLFVQRDFKDEFVAQLAEHTASIKVGDPMDETTAMGPVASKEQFDRVQGYLAVGKDEGATARAGGTAKGGAGYFVEPTIFDDVTNSMRIAREEIFGPVVSIIPFADEDDAVLQGNDTRYGLGASVWTRDASRAHRVARRIKAGTVWVNTSLAFDPTMPFGGYKQSGYGRDLGLDWYQHYTQEKAVFVQL